MNSNDMSIKLLTMFEEVYQTRSVSRAAERLGMSQPSISIGLAKLRKHFNDPLFVRTSNGMEPTIHAQQLAQTVRRAMELLETALDHQTQFDPASATRTFRICMTDITQLVVLPRLIDRCMREAPGISLSTVRFGPDTLRELESGAVDVVVGYFPEIGSGFYEQTLHKRDFVCVCSATHPRLRSTITLKQFNAESHIAVTASGSGMRQAERALEDQRVKRRIVVKVPDFLGVEAIIADSEMIATMPRGVGVALASRGAVKALEHPIALPGYAVKQHWHGRFHLDPGNQWLRRLIVQVMASSLYKQAQ